MKIAILGLGEAGSAFANGLAEMGFEVSGWDPLPKRKLRPSIEFAESNREACREADIILSVNLSSVSAEVAKEVLPVLSGGQVYAEMNTSSPQQKIEIENLLKPSGVRFADVAIMAPVPPKGIRTPFLASGSGASLLQEKMNGYNLDIQVLSEVTGDASTRKLLRSIVYKGIAAVICEAVNAGKEFGLEDYIRSQISSVIGGNDALIDRFIEGSHEHAGRRIHEMEAVVHMLTEKKLDALMSEAARQSLTRILESRTAQAIQTGTEQ